MKRNPYKVFERVMRSIGWSLLAAFFLIVVVAATVVAPLKEGWGWWTFAILPGTLLALVVLSLAALGMRWVVDRLSDRWTRAKWNWEGKHRGEE